MSSGKSYSISQVELIRLVCRVGDAKARQINKVVISDPALQDAFNRKARHAGLEVKIIREVDSASPSLFQACAGGEVFLPPIIGSILGGSATKGGGGNKGGGSNGGGSNGGNKHKGSITITRELDAASPAYLIGIDGVSASLFAANAPDLRRICIGRATRL